MRRGLLRQEADRAVMFQEPALLPWLKVIDNVEFGLKMAGYPKAVRKEKAFRLLELMKMDDFANACVHELSGGMKQRVSLCKNVCNGFGINVVG